MNSLNAKRCIAAARFTATAIVATGLLLIAAGRWTWHHRQQIAAALLAAIAALVVAAQATYAAGRWCRQQLLELSDQAARLTAAQPLPIVAPITASIEALREALELLVRRMYPAIAA